MRDRESGWVHLHPGELFLLWQVMDLGELPAILAVPHIGRTARARAEMVRGANDALAERELGTVIEPAADVARMLRTVAAPELMLDLHTQSREGSFRAVSAKGRDGAVSLGITGVDVQLGPVRDTAMAASLFDAVTPVPAGPGRTANVRVADFEAACAAGERDGSAGFGGALRDAGVRPPEVATLSRAVAERAGGGQFGGSVRTPGGQWSRSSRAFSWVDTAEARYALRSQGEWLTVTPADNSLLLSMARDLVDGLSR